MYYEAGYARGLKLPVICLCEDGFFHDEGVHFDTSHYPFIFWDHKNGDELTKALENHIIVTIGRNTNFQTGY